MNLNCPKQYYSVNNKMIIDYTLEPFNNSDTIDKIVIVIADEWIDKIGKGLKDTYDKIVAFASPGRNRQESIIHGLDECINRSKSNHDKVIIHDAVRPCVSEELIQQCLSVIPEYDGSMPVLPMKDTVYHSDDGEMISSLLDRSKIYAGQAPEAYLLHKYYDACKSLSDQELMGINGSTEVAIKYGMNISLIPGEERNFKITTQEDLKRFKEIVEGETMRFESIRFTCSK